jgi:folate-binding protein YgfZ
MAASPATHSASSAEALVAARDAAVVCELTQTCVLAIAGADAEAFLHGQLSCDVKGLPAGACRYASFNSPKGRMLANFPLWRDPADAQGFRVLLPSDIAQPVAKRLSMYVLRSKVTLSDISAETARFGVGGPDGAGALESALGVTPAPFEARTAGSVTILGLPGPRFVLVVAAQGADATRAALVARAKAAPYDVWQWLTIRAGVPIVTAATQDAFVAQTANWDVLGGVDFQKGCYTGQEIIARTQFLGRLKERAFLFHVDRTGVRPGERIFSEAFPGQPCGTVVNAAPAPEGGCDLLAVVQVVAAEKGDARLGAPDGPALAASPLPYAIPAPSAPRGRIV